MLCMCVFCRLELTCFGNRKGDRIWRHHSSETELSRQSCFRYERQFNRMLMSVDFNVQPDRNRFPWEHSKLFRILTHHNRGLCQCKLQMNYANSTTRHLSWNGNSKDGKIINSVALIYSSSKCYHFQSPTLSLSLLQVASFHSTFDCTRQQQQQQPINRPHQIVNEVLVWVRDLCCRNKFTTDYAIVSRSL